MNEDYNSSLYRQACSLMDAGQRPEDFQAALNLFAQIPGYMDADIRAYLCREKINEFSAQSQVPTGDIFIQPIGGSSAQGGSNGTADAGSGKKPPRKFKPIIAVIAAAALLIAALAIFVLPNLLLSDEAKEFKTTVKDFGEVTLSSKNDIENAFKAYTKLDEKDQSKVKAAYKQLVGYKVEYLDLLIDEIGTVGKDSLDGIDAAEKYYETIPEGDRGSAKKSYDRLMQCKVDYLNLLIDEIGGGDIYSMPLIKKAQAYQSTLPEEWQKKANISALDSAVAASENAFNSYTIAVRGKIGSDGHAYIPLGDGTVYDLDGDICLAVLCSDRDTICVLAMDGTLYLTSVSDPGRKDVMDTGVTDWSYWCDEGVGYHKNTGLYRCNFSDKNPVCLTTASGFARVFAEDSTSSFIADSNGDLWLCPRDASSSKKIATWDCEKITVEYVSYDGDVAVWLEKDDGKHTVKLYQNGTITNLGTWNNDSDSVAVYTDPERTITTIGDYYAEAFHFIPENGNLVTVKLEDEMNSNSVWTDTSYIESDRNGNIGGMYIKVDNANGKGVYYVDMNGSVTEVLPDVNIFSTANGRVFYTNGSDELMTGLLDGAAVSEEVSIDANVVRLTASQDGSVVYYLKDKNESTETVTLCRWLAETGESEVISTNVYADMYKYLSYFTTWDYYMWVSDDGSTVAYFENVTEEMGGSEEAVGTLWIAKIGEDPRQVSDNAIVKMPSTGVTWGFRPDCFYFEKYVAFKNDEVMIDYCSYCDGSVSVLASNAYMLFQGGTDLG